MNLIKGYKVNFAHVEHEPYEDTGCCKSTHCTVEVEGDPIVYFASADCSPKDRFDKKIGRKVAFKRAVAEFPKPIRSELWAAYLKRCKY